MSAIVPANGAKLRQLDKPAEPDEQVRQEDVADTAKLAQYVMRIMRDVARIKRRFWTDFIEFEDVSFDASGSTVYRFPHGFNGRVRWWVVDVYGSAYSCALVKDETQTDDNTLCLVSNETCVATIRIERAG